MCCHEKCWEEQGAHPRLKYFPTLIINKTILIYPKFDHSQVSSFQKNKPFVKRDMEYCYLKPTFWRRNSWISFGVHPEETRVYSKDSCLLLQKCISTIPLSSNFTYIINMIGYLHKKRIISPKFTGIYMSRMMISYSIAQPVTSGAQAHAVP